MDSVIVTCIYMYVNMICMRIHWYCASLFYLQEAKVKFQLTSNAVLVIATKAQFMISLCYWLMMLWVLMGCFILMFGYKLLLLDGLTKIWSIYLTSAYVFRFLGKHNLNCNLSRCSEQSNETMKTMHQS